MTTVSHPFVFTLFHLMDIVVSLIGAVILYLFSQIPPALYHRCEFASRDERLDVLSCVVLVM